MKWKHPPTIKIYEAIGAVADGRVEVSENSAKVYSSTRNKCYDVTYDPDAHAIMSNDNGSFWKGYIGYPAIAFLLKKGVVSYSDEAGKSLAGIAWKDINQKFKNDFDKALGHILSSKTPEEKELLADLVAKVDSELKDLNLSALGSRKKPPEGY